MIIVRTPFRVSFFGGGTDYPDWYNEHGGVVLTTSIDKYGYITCRYLPPFFDYKFRIRYSVREETETIDQIKHPSVRECLKFLKIDRGVEVQHNADLPAMSGLGSSSSFSVGLLQALYALRGKMITRRQLAKDAIHVEQNLIGESVGSQDQTIASFGGFNKVTFNKQQGFEVEPLIMNANKLAELQKHLMLFFVGFPRRASVLAKEQIENIPNNTSSLKRLMQMTEHAINALADDATSLDEFGKLLDENWKIKRTLTQKITNSDVDQAYSTALSAGALGGKLLGAGGGGFMLIFSKPELREKIKEKLKPLLYVPFRFENLGSQIIFYNQDECVNDVL
ncbi:MAG: kinase [Candidatus Omnitrophica bacterium]|nr:kinase [Candidatus Omnitrophota bacterium]